MCNAILFDFDFTLIDSSQGIVRCFNNALSNLQLPTCSENDIIDSIGEPLELAVKRLCPNFNVSYDVFYKLFMDFSKEIMLKNTNVYEDTIYTLQELSKLGYKIGIVSSKDHCTIKKISKNFNFDKYIDVIVGEDDVIYPKPNPDGINYAISSMGVKKNKVIYVGDNLLDAYAAKNANVKFFPLLSGTTNMFEFKKMDIEYCFLNNLCDVLKHI